MREVFKNWSYILAALAISIAVFAVAVWFPNIRLLFSVWFDSTIPFADKILLAFRLLESITTNFTALSASYTIATAILLGINVSLIVYLLRMNQKRMTKGGMTAGVSGLIAGSLGMGCAACGSLILTSILSVVGGAGILAFLPLKGGEFGIIGVALLGYSTYLLSKYINRPPVCKI